MGFPQPTTAVTLVDPANVGTVRFGDGSAAAPSISFVSSPTTGIFDGVDTISFTYGGVQKMFSSTAGMLLLDGWDVYLGSVTGSKFGSAATEKIAALGATPIVRPAATTDLRTALINLGWYASGGASPLDLNGGLFSTTRAAAFGLQLRSGASVSWTGIDIGRTAAEAALAITSATTFFTGTADGDAALRLTDTAKILHIGVGTGVAQLKVANAAISFNVVATATVANGAAMAVRSGAAGSWTSYNLGRTASEAELALTIAGSSFTGTAAGDVALRDVSTSNAIHIGIGTAVAQLVIANTQITIKDGVNVGLYTTTGTKWGTGATQKQSWWGAPTIVQPARVGQLTDNSGGTSGGATVAVVTDIPSAANAIATLTARVNALELIFSQAGGGTGLTA